MGKGNDAFAYIATTGTAVAIGTNIDLLGWCRGSDLAGTITIADSAGTALFVCSATMGVTFAQPIALNGPITMTSSAGRNFIVFFRKRSVA